ncbi:MAG: M20/M25/M40 family metallo-hydrolase [Bryobacteraceae bacterium]
MLRLPALRRTAAVFAALVLAAACLAAELYSISAAHYRETVTFLASPEMKGRMTGSPELETAAQWLVKQYQELGIPPAAGTDYIQRYEVTVNASLGADNRLAWSRGAERHPATLGGDFRPFNFSANGAFSGPLVFAGYGISAPEYGYDDYAGLDVKDKVVVVLRHEPQEFDDKSVFAGKVLTRHSQLDNKAVNAKYHGAKAVIFINDLPNHTDPDELDRFSSLVGPGYREIAFVQVRVSVANEWFAAAGKDLKTWIASVDKDLKPASFAFPADLAVEASIDVRRESKMVPNVAAYLAGESNEYVILGAHFDHLGMGTFASMAPDMAGKAIHPGADDNASGTAGVIELARYFASRPKPKRGLLFLNFSGEEMGLLGSSAYVAHPLLPLDRAVAMINMDMIGRIRDGKVFVGGTATGTTLKALLDAESPRFPKLKLDLTEQGGYGSSDHQSFTVARVPVLFFFSGLHADYHKPGDTPDKIDAEHAAELLELVAATAKDLADTPARPQFVRTAAPSPMATASASSSGYGVYFGSVPDMSEVAGGFRLADVRDGGPAAKAGMKAGDIMYEFAGTPIKNLYDFSQALRMHKPGDEVLVKWRRDGKEMEGKTVLTVRH